MTDETIAVWDQGQKSKLQPASRIVWRRGAAAVEFLAIMGRDYFDPLPEEQVVVLVDAATVRRTEELIESCEHCNPAGAEIPFDHILDRITVSDPSVTDYLLEAPAKCPRCRLGIVEKTLVEPA